jgi:hypothetical protein
MTLDSEDQRDLLIQLIDGVPVQGNVGQLLPFALKVQELKLSILQARVELNSSQEMLLSR